MAAVVAVAVTGSVPVPVAVATVPRFGSVPNDNQTLSIDARLDR